MTPCPRIIRNIKEIQRTLQKVGSRVFWNRFCKYHTGCTRDPSRHTGGNQQLFVQLWENHWRFLEEQHSQGLPRWINQAIYHAKWDGVRRTAPIAGAQEKEPFDMPEWDNDQHSRSRCPRKARSRSRRKNSNNRERKSTRSPERGVGVRSPSREKDRRRRDSTPSATPRAASSSPRQRPGDAARSPVRQVKQEEEKRSTRSPSVSVDSERRSPSLDRSSGGNGDLTKKTRTPLSNCDRPSA